MDIEWFRDLVIIIAGLLVIISLITCGILALVLYGRIKSLLNTARELLTRTEKAQSTRLSQVALIIQALASILNSTAGFLRRKGGKDGK